MFRRKSVGRSRGERGKVVSFSYRKLIGLRRPYLGEKRLEGKRGGNGWGGGV